jgi:multiple sugar transport system substrate-binding protein
MVASIAVLTLVAGACTGGTSDEGGSGDGEQVTLDFWVFSEIESGSFYDELVTGFEAANPNVQVELTSFPENNYDVKVSTAVAANKAPDLILIFGSDYPRRGLVLPLDDMVAEEGIDLSSFSQAIVGEGGEFSCGYEGQLYCLGSYTGLSALVYNKELFDAAGVPYPAAWPPMTPDEFVDIACQLTDPANEVWGGGAADPMSYLPWEIYVTEDARTTVVNQPSLVHEFEVLGQGFRDGCFPSLNIVDPWSQGMDYFSKGQLAMVVTDYLGLEQIEKAGIDYGSTGPPTPVGYEPYFYSWTDSVAVMANSDHPEEATAFIAYLATDGQRIRYDTTGDLPLDLTVAEDVDWAKGIPGREEGLEVASHARAAIFYPGRWDVIGPLYDAWGFVTAGEKSAQQALDEVAPATQEELDKAWETWEEQG